MINFTRIKQQNFFTLFAIVLSGFLLQGCGGQREAPLDTGSSSSSTSRGASITMTQLIAGDTPVTNVDENGQIKALGEDEFQTFWDQYSTDTHQAVDFTKGQVLLVDLGKKRICDRKLTLQSFAAYDFTTNSVLVTLSYKDSGAGSSSSSSSSSSASCSDAVEKQPYYFFYVQSLDNIVIEEDVN